MFNLDTFRQLKDSIAGQAKSLGEMAKPYHDNIVGSLAGAAVGGGLGAFATDTDDDKTTGQKWRHRAGNALTGALAGGAVGAAAPVVRDYFNVPKKEEAPPKVIDRTLQFLKNKVTGATDQAPQAVKDTASGVANFAKEEALPLINPAEGSPVGRGVAGAAVAAPAAAAVAHMTHLPDHAAHVDKLKDQIKTYEGRVNTPAVPPSLPGAPGARTPAVPAGAGGALPAEGLKMTNAERLAQLQKLNASGTLSTAELRAAKIKVPTKFNGKGSLAALLTLAAGPTAAVALGGERAAAPAPIAKPAPAIK